MKVRLGPSGVHFLDRASGLNVLLDEVIPHQNAWAAAPRHVSIAITNICDLACSYCFAPKTHAVLALEDMVGWLHELDANGTVGVGFGGGEPTLHPQFAELCVYASRNTDLAITFTTHGHHLDDRLLDTLKGNVHFIRVSMDGVEETYERLRRRPFNALRERLEAIGRIGPFGINYVVNADTLPDIRTAATLAEGIGATEFLLLPEQPANGHGDVDDVTTRALRTWVSQYSGSLRLAVSVIGAEGLPVCDPFENETGLRAYAHVDACGLVKRSSFDTRGIPIGPEGIILALQQLHHQFPKPL